MGRPSSQQLAVLDAVGDAAVDFAHRFADADVLLTDQDVRAIVRDSPGFHEGLLAVCSAAKVTPPRLLRVEV